MSSHVERFCEKFNYSPWKREERSSHRAEINGAIASSMIGVCESQESERKREDEEVER